MRNTEIIANQQENTISYSGVIWEYAFITVCALVSVTFRAEINSYLDYQEKLFDVPKESYDLEYGEVGATSIKILRCYIG